MSPEWVWTLLALAGVAVGGWGVLDAWHDVQAVGVLRDRRFLIARGDLRAELIRLAIQGSWLWIGVDVILTPGEGQWSRGALVLIVSVAALLLNSALSLRLRFKLRRFGSGGGRSE